MPLFLIEWWFVCLAILFVIAIETFIINIFLKKGIKTVFLAIAGANIATTIGGYFVQGFCRLLFNLLLMIIGNYLNIYHPFFNNPLVQGALGGIGPVKGVNTELSLGIITSILTSILITFLFSLYFEKKALIKELKITDERIAFRAVLSGNLISYLFLTAWIMFKYLNLKV